MSEIIDDYREKQYACRRKMFQPFNELFFNPVNRTL